MVIIAFCLGADKRVSIGAHKTFGPPPMSRIVDTFFFYLKERFWELTYTFGHARPLVVAVVFVVLFCFVCFAFSSPRFTIQKRLEVSDYYLLPQMLLLYYSKSNSKTNYCYTQKHLSKLIHKQAIKQKQCIQLALWLIVKFQFHYLANVSSGQTGQCWEAGFCYPYHSYHNYQAASKLFKPVGGFRAF